MTMKLTELLNDEFETINLLTHLEAEFNIVLPENVYENIQNLDQFSKFIIQDGKAF
jgi:hypothetical protein